MNSTHFLKPSAPKKEAPDPGSISMASAASEEEDAEPVFAPPNPVDDGPPSL